MSHRAQITHGTGAGWRQRVAAAERRRDESRARDSDPHRVAVRRARAAASALHEAEGRGSLEWHQLNDPVSCPVTGRPNAVHPQLAALLSEFMQERGLAGHNPLEPITPTATKADLMAKHGAALRADFEAAGRALEALEAEMRETRPVPVAPAPVVKAVASETAILTTTEEPVKRGRGRPPKALAAALAAEGLDTDD